MNVKKVMSLCVLGIAITAGISGADTFKSVNSGGDRNWTKAGNWICVNNPAEKAVPGTADEVIVGNNALRITTAVVIDHIVIGEGGPAELVIDGGSLFAVGAATTNRINSAGHEHPGTLIVKNKGVAIFNGNFRAGFRNFNGGTVDIQDGTLRVAGTYYHNRDYAGTKALNTRTTIRKGGVLDVRILELNAGVLDVAEGTLVIRAVGLEQVNQWVAEGRIVAMGGEKGWKIRAKKDPLSGYLVVVAEPPLSAKSTNAGGGVCEKAISLCTTKKIIIGLAVAVLLLLLSLCGKRKRSGKGKPDDKTGKTYDY